MSAKKAKNPKAPKPPKAAKPPKAEKSGRKETRENPGKGHNLAALRKDGEGVVKRFIALSDSMASDMAGYRSDFKELYEEGANALGIKKSVLTKELKRILANKKAAEAEAEMAPDERQQIEMWRAAMEGTQFELFSAGDLAASTAPATTEELAQTDDPQEDNE